MTKNDDEARHIAEVYQKVGNGLLEILREAEFAVTTAQMERLAARIGSVTVCVDIAGPEHIPISNAVTALHNALGVKKIKGGAGSRAYEKITDLTADADLILARIGQD